METKKKMGRPKAEDPKSAKIQVRFTQSEYKRLRECAENHNLTMTQLIRQGALEKLSSMN